MNVEIKVGTKVVAPVTDSEGEVSFVVGKLIDINSRFAKVDIDGEVIRVGKTKIEIFETEEKDDKPSKIITCPECGSEHTHSFKQAEKNGTWVSGMEAGDRVCVDCGTVFKQGKRPRIADGYVYAEAKAASGRKSCDNEDQVAKLLRGKSLEEVYAIAAEMMGIATEALVNKYFHLNPGHQRMCVGNSLRGFLKRQSEES